MAAIEFNNQKMDAIIREARACGASDIHISEGMQTRYRVHGRLVQAQTQYSADETAELLQSMMNEKQKKHFANGNDADFAIRTSDGCRQRVNVFRQQKRMAATIRLLNSRIPTLEELHMPTVLYKNRHVTDWDCAVHQTAFQFPSHSNGDSSHLLSNDIPSCH